MGVGNKLCLCLHKEKVKTVVDGARTSLVGKIETVWNEKISPLT